MSTILFVTACGQNSADEPPAEFLNLALAANGSSVCYRLRQFLVTRRALGQTFQWEKLGDDTWALLELRPTTFEGPRPEHRFVYQRNGKLVRLIESASIDSGGELHRLDPKGLTSIYEQIFARHPDITPIPGCD